MSRCFSDSRQNKTIWLTHSKFTWPRNFGYHDIFWVLGHSYQFYWISRYHYLIYQINLLITNLLDHKIFDIMTFFWVFGHSYQFYWISRYHYLKYEIILFITNLLHHEILNIMTIVWVLGHSYQFYWFFSHFWYKIFIKFSGLEVKPGNSIFHFWKTEIIKCLNFC